MKTLVELFQWRYEGEYNQYFYAVEDVDKFLEEVESYLQKRGYKETSRDDCLCSFKTKSRVYIYPLATSTAQHINHCWFIPEYPEFKPEKARWNSYEN